MTKVIIVGNPGSSHTLNIATCFAKRGVECEVHSTAKPLDFKTHRMYADASIDLVFHVTAVQLRVAIERLSSDTHRVIAVGGHSYGQQVAAINGVFEKTLVLLGTEVTHNQGMNPKIIASYSKYSVIVVPSDYLRAKVFPFINHKKTRLYTRALGVHQRWVTNLTGSLSKPRDLPFKQYFVTAKSFKWIYGFEDILHAASEISATLRSLSTGLVFVGGGEERQKLEALAKKLLIEDLVLFFENMSTNNLVELVDNSITAIYPSEYESFGLSLVEAIARKKKPIVYDIPGFREATKNFSMAIPIKHNDVHGLSLAVKDAANNPSEYSQDLSKDQVLSLTWDVLGDAYIDACLDQVEKEHAGLNSEQKPIIFLNKYDMFSLQSRKNNLVGARLQRTYELYREFDRQRDLVHISSAKQSQALSILKYSDFSKLSAIYIEHGSIYSEQDHRLDQYVFQQAANNDVRVVYFISDYHAFDMTYLKSLNYLLHRFMKYRKSRKQQRALLQNSKNVMVALPTREINSVFKINSERVIELPPACRAPKEFAPRSEMSKNWSFIYGGGIGPFYQLQRFLLGTASAGRKARLFIRLKDFNAVDEDYQSILRLSPNELIYDQDMRRNVDAKKNIGVMLMEPINYIKTAFPVKFFDYLEAGIPVLAYKDTNIGRLVEKHGLGWVIDSSASAVADFAKQGTLDIEGFEKRRAAFLQSNTWRQRVKTIVAKRLNE